MYAKTWPKARWFTNSSHCKNKKRHERGDNRRLTRRGRADQSSSRLVEKHPLLVDVLTTETRQHILSKDPGLTALTFGLFCFALCYGLWTIMRPVVLVGSLRSIVVSTRSETRGSESRQFPSGVGSLFSRLVGIRLTKPCPDSAEDDICCCTASTPPPPPSSQVSLSMGVQVRAPYYVRSSEPLKQCGFQPVSVPSDGTCLSMAALQLWGSLIVPSIGKCTPAFLPLV
ncbi:hypothetical protein B0T17DRAFT_512587 [Bombardia bombarda]|uniref:Uncharacterized protein n=1 Tax=Bombardia bombarda TaxID=252184 RepID=A0AA39U1D2_9PEZI|nr:hypothetical protein B0T17DRAFT_512587 [Bombardia bombarda]